MVTFFDLPCLAVRATNGSIYLALRDLSDAVGVQLSRNFGAFARTLNCARDYARFA